MVFSSVLFIFQFLPISLILYYISPKKAKNLVLVIVSLVFYSWGEVRLFPVMIATIVVNYFCARLIARFAHNAALRKLFFIIALVVSLGFLVFFKYYNFLVGNLNNVFSIAIPTLDLVLPLGISFYTFQTLSYTIDVYRRTVPAEKNFINVAAFVTLFPQLIAGPIVRYTDINRELRERTITPKMLDEGMEQFVLGLARKVLIANNIGALWTEVENIGFPAVSTGLAWLSLVAFALQIYFDFSGYSQMAIGMGKMLGFEFPQNFDDPYTARSITDFWRRWHMTLGSWFREYLYFPLGGSRKGTWRTVLNLFVVWALTGLWHGASWNFVLWGLFFFVLLSIEKLGFLRVLDKHRVFSHIYTLLALLLGWTLFAITDFASIGVFLGKLFVPTFITGAASVTLGYYLRNYAVILLVGIFCCTNYAGRLFAAIQKRRWLRTIVIILLFLVCVAYLVDATYNPFLYFRF